MLNFTNVDEQEFNDLKNTVQKSVEKSDLDRFPLFSTDKIIKAKLFLLCYRFLLNAHNILLDTSGLKAELAKEIASLEKTYNNINYYVDFIESGKKYGKHLIINKLFNEVNERNVNDLIDVFAILTERVSIINMSRFKGVVLEGKSGDEFNRIMKSEVEE